MLLVTIFIHNHFERLISLQAFNSSSKVLQLRDINTFLKPFDKRSLRDCMFDFFESQLA